MNNNINRCQSDQHQSTNLKVDSDQNIKVQSHSQQQLQLKSDQQIIQNKIINKQEEQDEEEEEETKNEQQISNDQKKQKTSWKQKYKKANFFNIFNLPIPKFIDQNLWITFSNICAQLNQQIENYQKDQSNKDEFKDDMIERFYLFNEQIFKSKFEKMKENQIKKEQPQKQNQQNQNVNLNQQLQNQPSNKKEQADKSQEDPKQKIPKKKKEKNNDKKNNNNNDKDNNNINNQLNFHLNEERKNYQKFQPSDSKSQSYKSDFSNNTPQRKSVLTQFESQPITNNISLLQGLQDMIKSLINEQFNLGFYFQKEQANSKNQNDQKIILNENDFKNTGQYNEYVQDLCKYGSRFSQPKQQLSIYQQMEGQLLNSKQDNLKKAIAVLILKQKICQQTDDLKIKNFIIRELKNIRYDASNLDTAMMRQILLYCLSNQLKKNQQKNIEFLNLICQFDIMCCLILDHFTWKAFKISKKYNIEVTNQLFANTNNVSFIIIKQQQGKYKHNIIKPQNIFDKIISYLYIDQNEEKILILSDLTDEQKIQFNINFKW
ncbi:hypothetical protein ABPG74_006303 [Tetrahymena malaccensis]